MGIVIKQGMGASILAYAGVGLGYITTLIIFPKYLDINQIGLIRLIQSNGFLLIPIVTLGMPGVWMLKYPEIKDSTRHQSQFFSLSLFILLLASLLIVLVTNIFQEYIESIFLSKSEDYIKYISISLVILISLSLFEVISSLYRSKLNIIIPSYIKEVHLRYINLIIILAYGFDKISFQQTVYFIGLNYIIATLILMFLLIIKYNIRLTFWFFKLEKNFYKDLFKHSGYFTILSSGSAILSYLTFLLTATYLGLEENGIFTTCLYIGVIIEMPRRAASQILTPLFAESFNKNDHLALRDLYFKSSINLNLISFILFIGIILNLQDLFSLIPKGDVFREGTVVVILIGLSKIVGMAFGASGELLTYSPYKRYNIFLMIISSVVLVGSSIILIPMLGIDGAAWSILISTLVNQLVCHYWINLKLGLNPFKINHLKLLVISIAVFITFYFIPFSFSPLINIIIKSIVIGSSFMTLIYISNVSDELNDIINIFISRVRNLKI